MIIIYGASDDLIEINGDQYEEYNLYGHRFELELSDGRLIQMIYDKGGIWRFDNLDEDMQHISERGDGEANDEDGCPGYSEKIVIPSAVTVVKAYTIE
jgi:hypothetical protein